MNVQLPAELEAAIAEIASDRQRGATELSRRAAAALLAFPDLNESQITKAAHLVAASQPSMAPLFHLANRLCFAPEPESVRRLCEVFLRQADENERKISTFGADLIHDLGAAVLTHSFSGTVLSALRCARDLRYPFTVIATESLPGGEGAALVTALEQLGIASCLVPDIEAITTVRDTTLVLTGADAVTPAGVVNKVGTRAIATEAQRRRVPCFALASRHKFAGIVLPVSNLFEATAISQFTGVLTETGVLTAAAVTTELQGLAVHPALSDFTASVSRDD